MGTNSVVNEYLTQRCASGHLLIASLVSCKVEVVSMVRPRRRDGASHPDREKQTYKLIRSSPSYQQ